MQFSKRFDQVLLTNTFFNKKKLIFLQKNFSVMFCFLVLGFLTGNLFGTLLTSCRAFFLWDGFVVILLIFFIEVINYINYSSFYLSFNFNLIVSQVNKTSKFIKPDKDNKGKKKKTQDVDNFSTNKKVLGKQGQKKQMYFFIAVNLNMYKIGLLIGFFIDAFKVGS